MKLVVYLIIMGIFTITDIKANCDSTSSVFQPVKIILHHNSVSYPIRSLFQLSVIDKFHKCVFHALDNKYIKNDSMQDESPHH